MSAWLTGKLQVFSRTEPITNPPEELVKISVLHVFEHHDERVSVHANSIKLDDVLVL